MTAILGVDPGPTPGVVTLFVWTGIVGDVVVGGEPLSAMRLADWVAVERFIVGRGTARKTRGASMETIAQAVALHDAAKAMGKPVQYLPAGSVKPIVTDARLKRYGVWDMLKGPHQRDAARHAVFMGLQHGALDPLSV